MNTYTFPAYDTTPEGRIALAERLWGWVPHDGQRTLLTMRVGPDQEPGTLVAACGRRWGKTEALGCDVATRILTQPDLGQMGVAPTRDQAECLYDSVEEKLRELTDGLAFGGEDGAGGDDAESAKERKRLAALQREFPHLADLEFKRTPYPLIRNRRTGQMVFWVRAAGRNGRNLRGRGTTRKLKRFRVIVDERAYVDDEAVELAIKPMLATSPGGGQLVEISSPYRKRGGFYEDYMRGQGRFGRYGSLRLPSSQNPLVDREWLEEQRLTMTDNAFRTEFLAEFIDSAGSVFPEDDIAAAIVDDDYGDAPLWGCRYVAGLDLARRTDYTVLTVIEVGPNRLRVVALVRVQGVGFGGQVASVVEAIKKWGISRITVDRTGVGDPICESLAALVAENRLPCAVEEYFFTGPSKTVLIDRLVLMLSRRQVAFPPHPALLSELRNFEAIPTASGHEKLEAAVGHDDCVCSLALAVFAAAPLFTGGRGPRTAAVTRGPNRRFGEEGSDEWEFSMIHQGAIPPIGISAPCKESDRWRPCSADDTGSDADPTDGSRPERRRQSSRLWDGPPFLPGKIAGWARRTVRMIRTPGWRLLMFAYRFAPVRRAGACIASSMRSMRRFTR